MIDAVFISDLHLHPDDQDITNRFEQFIQWAATKTKTVYILGDFFHVWPGDDGVDSWSKAIAQRLAWLSGHGIELFYMHGNRDFLLGSHFASLAKLTIIEEPTIITLNNERILLSHGDRYCTNDKSHQLLMRLTRNKHFKSLFLKLPFKTRSKLVFAIREHSETNKRKPLSQMEVVVNDMVAHMKKLDINQLIHGHTHKPGLIKHSEKAEEYKQYVLSDWDDNPSILCYDSADGFYYNHITGV